MVTGYASIDAIDIVIILWLCLRLRLLLVCSCHDRVMMERVHQLFLWGFVPIPMYDKLDEA